MMKIKKRLTMRIINLLIAITFLCSNLAYSFDVSNLRVPIGSSLRDELYKPALEKIRAFSQEMLSKIEKLGYSLYLFDKGFKMYESKKELMEKLEDMKSIVKELNSLIYKHFATEKYYSVFSKEIRRLISECYTHSLQSIIGSRPVVRAIRNRFNIPLDQFYSR